MQNINEYSTKWIAIIKDSREKKVQTQQFVIEVRLIAYIPALSVLIAYIPALSVVT